MINPRKYQIEAVEAVINASERGVMRQLISLPTGIGKTIIFAMLAKHLGMRTLILAHREELLQQAGACCGGKPFSSQRLRLPKILVINSTR